MYIMIKNVSCIQYLQNNNNCCILYYFSFSHRFHFGDFFVHRFTPNCSFPRRLII